jgi:hypothetical protein
MFKEFEIFPNLICKRLKGLKLQGYAKHEIFTLAYPRTKEATYQKS